MACTIYVYVLFYSHKPHSLPFLGAFVSARKEKKPKEGKKCIPLVDALAENKILLNTLRGNDLLDILTAEGAAFTIFAPSDEAFDQPIAELGALPGGVFAGVTSIAEILLYHVLEKPMKAKELVGKKTVPTILDETISSCGMNTIALKVNSSLSFLG